MGNEHHAKGAQVFFGYGSVRYRLSAVDTRRDPGQAKKMKLSDLLSFDSIVIQCHDAPDADAILTDEWYRQGDQRAFLLQREDYYIRIMLSEDLPRETLQALIALLQ